MSNNSNFLAVIVASVGRPGVLFRTVRLIEEQTRRPDCVIIVGSEYSDFDGVHSDQLNIITASAAKGLCSQRNHGLNILSDAADVVVFFDDDFVPSKNYLEEVLRIFESHSEIIGITGNLLADGIEGPGLTFEQALKIIGDQNNQSTEALKPRQALYGCNMALRRSAIGTRRFDEILPLYGWLEDIDFTYPLNRQGRLVSSNRVTGVHLGVKQSRSSGRRLGYSQIANVVYLKRKGTMQPKLGRKLLKQQLVSNLFRSILPEPWIDRRGRLMGNLIAILHLATGRIHPQRILDKEIS